MNTKHDFCPGCGAQVYPEEAQCPFCGRSLRTSFLTPVVVGLGGTVFALVSGALVWWVLSSPPPQDAGDGRAASQVAAPVAEPPAPPAPDVQPRVATAPEPPPVEPAPAALPPEPVATSPAVAPAAAPPPPSTARMEPPALSPANDAGVSAFAPPTADADTAARPSIAMAPTTAIPTEAEPEGDPESRRAFAKSKQDSFAQNGLDLQVSTSGPEDKILTIKFNFSAKTAAELIVAGPFPKQCQQRGFTEILFQDPTGATWAYDIATQKMSVK